MGSPTEYVAELEAKLTQVRTELLRALDDRDVYQNEVHELNERLRIARSAASSAAGSTVIALERIQLMLPIVEAVQRIDSEAIALGFPGAMGPVWQAVEALSAYEKAVARRD